MKLNIKRLRTCAYSKPLVASGFIGQPNAHTNKLVCDHHEMKVDWTEAVCASCKVYVNRNKPSETEPAKKKAARKPGAAK